MTRSSVQSVKNLDSKSQHFIDFKWKFLDLNPVLHYIKISYLEDVGGNLLGTVECHFKLLTRDTENVHQNLTQENYFYYTACTNNSSVPVVSRDAFIFGIFYTTWRCWNSV